MPMREISIAAAAALLATAVPITAHAEHGLHLSYAPNVQWSWYLTKAAPAYRADKRIEVRTDPDPESPTTRILSRGEIIESAGQTQDGWVALSENGVVVGYASASVMSPMGSVGEAD